MLLHKLHNKTEDPIFSQGKVIIFGTLLAFMSNEQFFSVLYSEQVLLVPKSKIICLNNRQD